MEDLHVSAQLNFGLAFFTMQCLKNGPQGEIYLPPADQSWSQNLAITRCY